MVWLGICIGALAIWSATYFNPEIRKKQCIAIPLKDDAGGFMRATSEDGTSGGVNVAKNFEFLALMFFIQSIIMFACQLYQIIAIFLVKGMLRYRMIVSRVNKLNLLFATVLLAVAYSYRFSEAGKFCSGDLLSSSDRDNASVSEKYLTEEGATFASLIHSCKVVMMIAAAAGVVLGIAAWMAFK